MDREEVRRANHFRTKRNAVPDSPGIALNGMEAVTAFPAAQNSGQFYDLI